jgi:hypothetical protein
MEERISRDNVEMMVVKTETRQWERRTADELDTVIATLA